MIPGLDFLYKYLAKPVFFKLDPYFVHESAVKFGKFLGSNIITKKITHSIFCYEDSKLEKKVFGIKFKNPVGLSAGFDKDGNLVNILEDVGFGFATIGTVTLKPYQGNPKPWLYRLPKSKALVVNFGLKSVGVDEVIKKLKNYKNPKLPLIISVGKTNSPDTATMEQGIEDYFQCLKKLNDNNIGDIYEINVSCPNTFGGEPFTTPEKLEALLSRLTTLLIQKPLTIKMPINIPWSNLKDLIDVIIKYNIADAIPERIKGNISGKPTFSLSNELISQTRVYVGAKLKIIGVGGVFSGNDAKEKIRRGADLVALITGMIYEGPQLIGKINRELVE